MHTKIILNQDLASLGEEGDVKEVAKGYARNFLFPRNIALQYTERTIKLFEARRGEIEARKEEKRKDALGAKEKIEELTLTLIMPAGANGKLYGAVTNLSIVDELAKQGFAIERKRIEVPGNAIKNVGKYKATIKLYGNASAELAVNVEAAEIKTEAKSTHSQTRQRRQERGAENVETGNEAPSVEAAAVETAVVEAPVVEAAAVEAPALVSQ
ncbi:MAG: 50S ribosomal protein L9 [Spirochaetaceae bacterium]|jgi:large subunit ribosomal protein L9|nr:50S ribosomal protein L9 [Spirochaetaceae bacterium]